MMKPNAKSEVKFGKEARDSLMEGINLVCEATATTLGPRGRNVAIDYDYAHTVLHDGVSVSEAVIPADPYQRLGAKIIKEAAKKQRDVVGDGTTLTLILAQAIIKESLKVIETGVNPMSLRRELEQGSEKIIKELEKIAKPVKTLREKVEVATISAEDEYLGKIIAETLDSIGKDGVITVEESKGSETIVEKQDGMQFDKGYMSPYFITDPRHMIATLEGSYILVTDKNLTNFMDILPFLENVFIKESHTITIIAPEISTEVFGSFLQNKSEGKLLSLCILAPSFGANQKNILQDIAILTGATLISGEMGHRFQDLKMDQLGKAERITATKDATLIVGGAGKPEDVQTRIESIKTQLLDLEVSEFDKEKLRERLGKLSNGIAVLKVGGNTEVEMKERKERAIDAVSATQAAMEKGIVAGGEIAFMLALDSMGQPTELGSKILANAILQPFKRLVENAGYDAGELKEQRLRFSPSSGFDVTDGKFKDLFKAGIIDPVLVCTEALKNAVSVAVSVISTGASIITLEEKKDK